MITLMLSLLMKNSVKPSFFLECPLCPLMVSWATVIANLCASNYRNRSTTLTFPLGYDAAGKKFHWTNQFRIYYHHRRYHHHLQRVANFFRIKTQVTITAQSSYHCFYNFVLLISFYHILFRRTLGCFNRCYSSQGLMSVSMAIQLYAAYRSFSSATLALENKKQQKIKRRIDTQNSFTISPKTTENLLQCEKEWGFVYRFRRVPVTISYHGQSLTFLCQWWWALLTGRKRHHKHSVNFDGECDGDGHDIGTCK